MSSVLKVDEPVSSIDKNVIAELNHTLKKRFTAMRWMMAGNRKAHPTK
jgi:hypothetical protein